MAFLSQQTSALSCILLLTAVATSASESPQAAFSVLPDSTDGLKICRGRGFLSCQRIEVNFEAIESPDAILIPEVDIVMEKKGQVVVGKYSRIHNYQVRSQKIPSEEYNDSSCYSSMLLWWEADNSFPRLMWQTRLHLRFQSLNPRS